MKHEFNKPVQGEDRRARLLEIFSHRGTENSAGYWDNIRNVEPSVDDLDALLPREELPKIVDGEIEYQWVSIFHENGRKKVPKQRRTQSATHAERFLSAIEYIRENDPEFLNIFGENISDYGLLKCIFALHLTGEEQELKEQWLSNVRNMDSFLLRYRDLSEDIEGNEYYPLDNYFMDAAEKLVGGYVKHKLPSIQQGYFVDYDDLHPALSFAAKYHLDGQTIQYINTQAPLPESIRKVHLTAGNALHNDLLKSPDLVNYLFNARRNFDDLDQDAKGKLFENILNLLASTYDIEPPPSFEWAELNSAGDRGPWSEIKEECFLHPMGKVRAAYDFCDSFDTVLEIACHEFCHGLEDLSMMMLNPDFQKWYEKEGMQKGVRIGDKAIQKNLMASGFAFAFNSASSIESPLNGDGLVTPYFQFGKYYLPRDDWDKTEEQKAAREKIYTDQLRERHARCGGGHLEGKVINIIEMAERYRDPTSSILLGQNLMYPIQEWLTHPDKLDVPIEKKSDFIKRRDEINETFRLADSRNGSFKSKLLNMQLALHLSAQLMMDYIPKDGEDKKEVNILIDKSLHASDVLQFCKNLLVYDLSRNGQEHKLAGQELQAHIT